MTVTKGVRSRKSLSSLELIPAVRDGSTRAMARLISRIESGDPERREALTELYRQGGKARVVGLTGVPGCGKSTLVREYAKAHRARGQTIAVLAIDPSSPFSGGARRSMSLSARRHPTSASSRTRRSPAPLRAKPCAGRSISTR
jgi:LAO/AO transport system kinase